MQIKILYGEKTVKCEIPERNLIKTLSLNDKSEKSLTNRRYQGLEEFLEKNKRTIIIVNDHERATPTFTILGDIYSKIKDKRFEILIASGAHRPPREEELKRILGEKYWKLKEKIKIHNAEKIEETSHIGKTRFKNQVYVNRRILEAEKIIVIGSVEPHYFAGYTGGRKFLLPGISRYETIEYNHKFALDKNAQPLRLKDNPVHEDMMEALKLLDREEDIYSIMTVINRRREIIKLETGNINETFMKCVEKAKKFYTRRIEEKVDIIIAVAESPFNISLYQAHKAIENVKSALKDEGIIILVAECKEGIGPRNFYNLLSSTRKPEEIVRKIEENYRLGYHKAARLAELMRKAEIWAVTSLEKNILTKINLKPFTNLQKAIDEALKEKGRDAEIMLINEAATIIPILGN